MNRMEAVIRAQESEHCLRPAGRSPHRRRNEGRDSRGPLERQTTRQIPFSRLYETVETDTSPQFNYHLEAAHRTVRSEDRRRLRTPERPASTSSARSSPGRSTLTLTSSRSETGDDCCQCGSPLRASYDDERLAIDCPACGRTHGEYSFPPGGLLDRTRDEILTAFDRRVRRLHCLATDGVCPACSGRMRTELVREGDCCLDVDLQAEYTCEQCHHSRCSTVGLALLDQSAVVAFYRDHGIDLESARYWQFDWCVGDEYTTVRSTDPWRIAVSIPLEDDTLESTLDGELSVIETQRL